MTIEKLTKAELAGMMDHTNLHADAISADLKKLCEEAAAYSFAAVAVHSVQTKRCRGYLGESGVHVAACTGFPAGQTSIAVKLFETEGALADGADEIDYVVNLTEVREGNWAYVEEEMSRITALCHQKGAICKVIFENCALQKDEIRKLAEIARRVGIDFIKTSTGFGSGGAKAEDVRLMKETAGSAVQVKAAGGIRSWADCRKMLEAGATRIGTSGALRILKEFEEEQGA